MTTDPNEAEWGSVCPFWIDTPAYTQRDQEMFVVGYEFCEVLAHIRHFPEACSKTIHRENESRIRMACGKFGRQCSIESCAPEHDPDGTWSYLTIMEKAQ
jgi:hypothetical protein